MIDRGAGAKVFGRRFSSDEAGDGPTAIASLMSPRSSPRTKGHRAGSPRKREPVRLKRAGGGASDRARREGFDPRGIASGLPNQLIVHTVADDSALHSYIPGARLFLLFCEDNGLPVATTEEKDKALADASPGTVTP